MPDIYFISLGCDKNRIDAEIMARRLIEAGHSIVAQPSEADCAIVNTCGFIDSAKQEAIESIFDMVREKEQGSVKAVVVTGCLAQRYAEELQKEIPEVDAVIGLKYNDDICGVVARAMGGEKIGAFGNPEELTITGARQLSTPQHYAYLKIAEGCSNKCTFCAIPGIRGAYRSRAMQEITDEANALSDEGVREIILIAQDTTSYGKDLNGGESLAVLLDRLCGIEGIWRIRLLYAYPDKISGELIETMACQPKIAKYIDIPMQHCSTDILRRMGRFGDRAALVDIIAKLRAAMPDITVRSTFIVGFPGETEEQFTELIDFLKDVRLDRVGCFAYSPEEDTPAARLPQQHSDGTKNRRAEQFMTVQTRILSEKLQTAAGNIIEVICDGYDEEKGCFACRGDGDAPDIDTCVLLPLECDLMPGEVYSVRITGTDGADCYGELV